MNSKGFAAIMKIRWVSSLVVLLLLPCGYSATVTNVWPFTTPAQYVVSDPSKIEVADGVAKLKLQANHLINSDLSEYPSDAASLFGVGTGPDASVGLKRSGSQFPASGEFESRVFDGGTNGNVWQSLNSRFINRNQYPALGALYAGVPNLVSLFHLDNSAKDEIRGISGGTLVGSTFYSSNSVIGPACLGTYPGWLRIENPTLLDGQNECTLMCWVSPWIIFDWSGLVLSRGPSFFNGLFFYGSSSVVNFTITTQNGTYGVKTKTVFGRGSWYHVAAVKDATSSTIKLYVNGVLEDMLSGVNGTIRQDAVFNVPSDSYSSARTMQGGIDEVAVFSRALSSDEIRNIYIRTSCAGLRLRSGDSLPLTSDYVGPDGTTNSFYAKSGETLISVGAFSVAHRYLQYKTTFLSDTTRSNSPYLDAVKLTGSAFSLSDDNFGQINLGNDTTATTNLPSGKNTSYVRMAKQGNGGEPSDAAFVSRVWDAGAPATWNQLMWTFGGMELPSTLAGLEGLWHMNETWDDVTGKGHAGSASGGLGFSSNAKLGTRCASFNGVDGILSIGSMGVPINTVEWWMKTAATDCGVMELLTTQAWVSVTNGMVRLGGSVATGTTVYVNGGLQPQLLPGWNHVMVEFPGSVSTTAVVIGRANGVFFPGLMDELAIYSRVLSQAEAKEHCANGRRSVAGQIRMRARADNNNPPQTLFIGLDGTVNSYFVDSTGSTLPNAFAGKRYFQYKAYLLGDGDATPGLNSVSGIYAGSVVVSDSNRMAFSQGVYTNDGVKMAEWAGDSISRESLQSIGPSVTDSLNSSGMMTYWRMDDASLTYASPTVHDYSGNGRHGTPNGTVFLGSDVRVGSGSAFFLYPNSATAANGVITASGGVVGTGDYTVSFWWNSVQTSRCALVSSYVSAGTPYYAIELNPSNAAPGSLAFVVSDGASLYAATSFRNRWTDGQWHHVSAVREGGRLYLYLDGTLDGAVSLPPAAIDLGAVSLSLGKYGTQNIYYSGSLDEVLTHSRALKEWEISELAASGFNTRGVGLFAGPVMDGGQPTYWEKIHWTADAPYGQEHLPDSGSILGLWHCNVISNGVTSDASGYGNDGVVEGGGAIYAPGRLGSCLSLTGAAQRIRIADNPSLASSSFSWETWVWLTTGASAVLLDKSNVGTGCRLGTDASGRPYWQVGSAVCTAVMPLRLGQWYHLAGTCDGVNIGLYVNGRLRAMALASGSALAAVDAVVGNGNGLIDEMALYNRPLGVEEILDHYRAGAVTLGFRARSWAANDTPGDFVGSDGTTNSLFTSATGSLMTGVIPLNQYFQYQAVLATEDAALTPMLQGIQVDASFYPSDNPWVAPANGYGSSFYGNLLGYMHILGASNNDTQVRYQISGNNGSNWYAWVGSQWTDVSAYTNSVASWNFSNQKDVIAANIGSFYDQLYPKVGGIFKFKASLKSDAIQQVAVDEVRLAYSPGRLVMVSPNGAETNQDSWLEGVPYTVQWTSAGTVGNVKLEYSLDSGANWTTIATNVPNVAGTNNYNYWTTPSLPNPPANNCRVRVTDMNDATISDLSDSDFSIVERFRMLAPNGGEIWYTGRTNVIRWASALNLGLLRLDYAADGSNYLYNVALGLQNSPGTTTNIYPWATPLGVPAILSETGRMRIQTFAGGGVDASDNPFTLAGIEFTNPTIGSSVKRNGPFNIQWVSAGAGAAVALDFSTDGGTSWTNVVASVPNVAGSNSYIWVATAPPTDTARLRMRSLSDTNVIGLSEVYTLADIDVTMPNASSTWLMGTTNTIYWQSGGAGNAVNIYYSTNAGLSWVSIQAGVANVSGSNSFAWRVPPYPGSKSQVKVESVQDPVNLWAASPNFNIAGIRVTSPNGGETWVKNVQNYIQWEFQSVGQLCSVQFSYDGGITYTNIGGPGLGLSDRTYVYTPTIPTVRAKAKVLADNPVPYTNVFDESDIYFTVAGITVSAPTNGMLFTIGTTNAIAWTSAGSEDPLGQARIYYTTTGADSNLIVTVGNNQAFPGGNSFQWSILPGVIPSATARIIIQSGSYSGSSLPFILRGIKFTVPALGAILDIGGSSGLGWVFAGIDASANGYIYLSTDGGATFGATALNASQIWPVQAGGYPWSISSDTMPTTNAVLKYKVASSSKPEDINFEALSQSFILRGMKFLQPTSNTVWSIGQTNAITWLSARAGTYVTLNYSQDGVTYDTARPIVVNQTLLDGTNTCNWPIESFRMPSTNARIRAVSSTSTAYSKPFTVQGIRVTAPTSSDVWAKDETNTIVWTAVGGSGIYNISILKDGTTTIPIASNITALTYDWVVTSNTVSTNDIVVVQDTSGLRGVSDTFRIVGQPSIAMVSPMAGEFLKVSQPYTLSWSKGGKMQNDFLVQYSSYPYVVTNDIYTGVADFNSSNNTYSVPWTVPDRLGNNIIIVQNNIAGNIATVSDPFSIVGLFTILSPNGGETNIYALKPITISWTTRGSVSAVNLFYSTDPLHGDASWVPINNTNTPIANNGGGLSDILTTYDWIAARVDSTTVRIRVEQVNQPGAYDDSDADFSIRYYQIIWHIYDLATSLDLDQLSVSETSGWSQGGLSSPVTNRYAYGTYDTVWSREFFYNNVVFKWSAEPSRTIDVAMKRSDVEPNFTVMANFVYDPTNSQYRVNSWLEQTGRLIPAPEKCTISVYDSNGTLVAQQISTTHDASGVFWQVLPNTLQKGGVYFAKVEIIYSAVTYSSGLTFNLRVPTDAETAQQMLNMLTNIQNTVSRVDTNLNDLSTAQADFRTGVMSKLDSLTNSAEIIKAGITNVSAKVDLLSTQAISRLDALTNAVGVIGPGETNLVEEIRNMQVDNAKRSARILTRPTSVKIGSTTPILYRTLSGLAATVRVFDSGGVEVAGSPWAMSEVSAGVGVYEKAITANWGIGDYFVQCSDTSGAMDRMVLKVTQTDLDEFASVMNVVSSKLVSVDNALSNMASISTDVSNMTAVVSKLGSLTNMAEQVVILTNAIGKIATLTNLSDQVAEMTNAVGKVAILTNLTPQVASLTNSVGMLMGITNITAQANILTNEMGTLLSLTNLNSTMGQIASLTNMQSQMNYVVDTISHLGGLTNLNDQVTALNGAIGQIASLTNMQSQMNYVVDAIGHLGGLTNLGAEVTALNGAIGQIASLTNLQSEMTYVVDAVNNLGGLTNLNSQVTLLNGAMGQIMGLTNLSTKMDALEAAINGMGGLTNLGSQVTLLNGAMGQIMALTNLSGQVGTIANTVNQLGPLTNMSGKVDQLLGTSTSLSNAIAALSASMAAFQSATGGLSAVSALGPTIASLFVSVSNVQTSMQGGLAVIQTGLDAMAAVNSNVYETLQTRLGYATDPATAGTIFGQLAAMELKVNAAGASAAAAVSKASGARSQASGAAAGLQKVKQELGTGQINKMADDLADVRKSIEAALKKAQEVPGEMSTTDLIKTLNEAAKTIRNVASEHGITSPLGSKSGSSEMTGSPTDSKTLSDLMNRLTETKAMMDATRQLMDEAINKPVVVDWLEGSK